MVKMRISRFSKTKAGHTVKPPVELSLFKLNIDININVVVVHYNSTLNFQLFSTLLFLLSV